MGRISGWKNPLINRKILVIFPRHSINVWNIYLHLVHVYGFHIGKYTVRPMDPVWLWLTNHWSDQRCFNGTSFSVPWNFEVQSSWEWSHTLDIQATSWILLRFSRCLDGMFFGVQANTKPRWPWMSRDVFLGGSFEDDDFPFPKVRYVLDMLVSWMVFFYFFCFCGKRCFLILRICA